MALGAVALYFFLLPLIFVPLLDRLGLIPDATDRLTDEERRIQKDWRDLTR